MTAADARTVVPAVAPVGVPVLMPSKGAVMTQHKFDALKTAVVDEAAAAITVEVFSDLICPWCYVASRRLADAVALFGADGGPAGPVPVRVVWSPFELNPDMPAEGLDRRAYRLAKFGTWQRSQQLDAHVAAVGAQDGLRFRHDLIARTPNTRAAHRLVWQAQQLGYGPQMVQALFAGYFTFGRDIGDRQVLTQMATRVGLSEQVALETVTEGGLAGERAEQGVVAGVARARALGVSGVPFYVFGDAYKLPAGAHPADAMAQVLRVVRQDQHADRHRPAAPFGAVTAPAAGSCDTDRTCL